MTATFLLVGLHIRRIFHRRGMAIVILALPLAAYIARALGLEMPKGAFPVASALFAACISVGQAAGDRNSGVLDGLRSTPAPDSALIASRIGAFLAIFTLQNLIFGIVSRMH